MKTCIMCIVYTKISLSTIFEGKNILIHILSSSSFCGFLFCENFLLDLSPNWTIRSHFFAFFDLVAFMEVQGQKILLLAG